MAGSSWSGSAPDLDLSFEFFLARYNPNGSLDTSFSGDGRQRTNFGGSDGASEVALQTNGKIVVMGHGGPGPGDFALARYAPNGSLDPSFSGDGKQTTDFFGGSDFANGMALQANGRIVAVGGTSNSSGVNDFALTRYNTNGLLDTSFSGDGKQTTSFSPGCSATARPAWCSRRTARSSRLGKAPAPTEQATSQLLATWGAEPRGG